MKSHTLSATTSELSSAFNDSADLYRYRQAGRRPWTTSNCSPAQDAAETWSEENDPEGVKKLGQTEAADLLAPALLRPLTSQCPSNIWLQAKRNSQFRCLHRRRARAAAEFGRYLITRDPTGHALKLGNLVIGPSAAVVTQRGTPCRNPKSPTSEKFPVAAPHLGHIKKPPLGVDAAAAVRITPSRGCLRD